LGSSFYMSYNKRFPDPRSEWIGVQVMGRIIGRKFPLQDPTWKPLACRGCLLVDQFKLTRWTASSSTSAVKAVKQADFLRPAGKLSPMRFSDSRSAWMNMALLTTLMVAVYGAVLIRLDEHAWRL
jgi:hypothetical protein